MDPRLVGNPEIEWYFKGRPYEGQAVLGEEMLNRTAAFVTIDGRIPPRIADRPEVRADPTRSVRFSEPGADPEPDAEAFVVRNDMADTMRDAVERAHRASATGDRVTVRLVVNRTPCAGPDNQGTGCAARIARYIREELPGKLPRPAQVTDHEWRDAMRRVDLEVHVRYAYEGGTGPTTTRELLTLENAGVRVVPYQLAPGVYGTRNSDVGHEIDINDRAAVAEDDRRTQGTSGEAVNDALRHLDEHRRRKGEVPRHWTDAAFPGTNDDHAASSDNSPPPPTNHTDTGHTNADPVLPPGGERAGAAGEAAAADPQRPRPDAGDDPASVEPSEGHRRPGASIHERLARGVGVSLPAAG